MADVYSLTKLSGSTDGKGIKISQTATAGNTLHTATAGSGDLDFVTLYAVNQHTADVVLTIEWGGATSPDNLMTVTIPFKVGPVLVVDRLPIMNSLVIAAFAATTNVIMVYGHVQNVVN